MSENEVRDPRRPRKVVVKRSPIHGRGVFAAEDIPKGAFVLAYDGKLVNGSTNEYVLDVYYDDGRVAHVEGTGPARYINHARPANLTFSRRDDDLGFYAIKKVRAGEELTWDYGDEFHFQ